jgi:hypothetical protein
MLEEEFEMRVSYGGWCGGLRSSWEMNKMREWWWSSLCILDGLSFFYLLSQENHSKRITSKLPRTKLPLSYNPDFIPPPHLFKFKLLF